MKRILIHRVASALHVYTDVVHNVLFLNWLRELGLEEFKAFLHWIERTLDAHGSGFVLVLGVGISVVKIVAELLAVARPHGSQEATVPRDGRGHKRRAQRHKRQPRKLRR